MDTDETTINQQYVEAPNHKVYYIAVLYRKNIVLHIAVESWIKEEMDEIALMAADELRDRDNIMTSIYEQIN